MCLLIKLKGEWPSDKILEAAEEQNRDGIGIAFPDGNKVRYYKGITMEQLKSFSNVTQGLIHFRVASIGPSIPQLAHPFPISRKTGLKLEGVADSVLAHNGHWTDWDKILLDNLKHAPMPRGAMSDTRAMAFLTAIHGLGFLRLLKEKVLVVTPTYTHQFGSGWKVEKDKGYELSYDVLAFRPSYYGYSKYDWESPASSKSWKADKWTNAGKQSQEEWERYKKALAEEEEDEDYSAYLSGLGWVYDNDKKHWTRPEGAEQPEIQWVPDEKKGNRMLPALVEVQDSDAVTGRLDAWDDEVAEPATEVKVLSTSGSISTQQEYTEYGKYANVVKEYLKSNNHVTHYNKFKEEDWEYCD